MNIKSLLRNRFNEMYRFNWLRVFFFFFNFYWDAQYQLLIDMYLWMNVGEVNLLVLSSVVLNLLIE